MEKERPSIAIAPGDYRVEYPTSLPDPDYIYALSVYGNNFESGSLANLFSGDSLKVVSTELAEISYRKAPWFAAGTPGNPARPRDGSWPAVSVEVEADGKIIRGLIPLFCFDRITPIELKSSIM